MTTNPLDLFGRGYLTRPGQLPAWGDDFKVGQPHLDAQHEAIFRIAAEVADAWHRHAPVQQTKALADRLDNVLQAHFRYEEAELCGMAYPRFPAHKAEHDKILQELHGIRCLLRSLGGDGPVDPALILHNFVLALTVEHIGDSDMDYAGLTRGAPAKAHGVRTS